MRIDTGAGYRMYFTVRDGRLVVLLCGVEGNAAMEYTPRTGTAEGGVRCP
jgi:putative component of toxin-antitoxin plasmid stabilization module